ncbi:MAG: hypothetical protein HY819_22655 [Acidobacteria bacterium]|nr:hypothetical protein [Acidobacteriota bacterium]
MTNQTIKATPSLKTALYSWLTKMIFQWVVFCGPMIFIFHFICPDVTFLLTAKLIMHSTLIALGVTGLMMLGKLTINQEGARFENKFLFQKSFISWKDMTFGRPFPIALEKHYVIADIKNSNPPIKIWPSMNNYKIVKQVFEDHKILIETGQMVSSKSQFRPLDEVISEAFK